MDSRYDNALLIAEKMRHGQHRKVIGGMWDEIGHLQRDFLIAEGLLPTHTLLDVGCGALRGGVKLISYLDPGNYWGIDKNPLLLEVGWSVELADTGLTGRQPREQLVGLQDFEFESLGPKFDYAIAQSVFTHLSLNRIRRCLARLAPCMHSGAHFYATFFEVGPGADREADQRHQPGGMTSHSDRSFYHYRQRDFAFAIEDLPWELRYIGDWGHPRSQCMLLFVRR